MGIIIISASNYKYECRPGTGFFQNSYGLNLAHSESSCMRI